MAKTFSTYAEFKRVLAVGDKLHAIHHLQTIGRDANGKAVYEDKDLGVRTVSIKQTNAFACLNETTKKDSWLHFPKASECKVINNTLEVYQKDMRFFKGGISSPGYPEYDNLPVIKVLTYKLVD